MSARHLGFLTHCRPELVIMMGCDSCNVTWMGCKDTSTCPQCGVDCLEPSAQPEALKVPESTVYLIKSALNTHAGAQPDRIKRDMGELGRVARTTLAKVITLASYAQRQEIKRRRALMKVVS